MQSTSVASGVTGVLGEPGLIGPFLRVMAVESVSDPQGLIQPLAVEQAWPGLLASTAAFLL